MSELKPCPFCGEKATLDYGVLPNRKHWFITCDCCGMMYQYTLSQRKYVKDGWNTRPIEDALNKRIAELEAGLISAGKQQGLYLQELMDLRAAQRWIPVSERLPDNWKSVLTIDISESTRGVVSAFYNPETLLWVSHFSDDLWVTHWMPLPVLPESPNDTQTQTIVYGKESEE
jgi:hypothetical protein